MWFRSDLRAGDNPALVSACARARAAHGRVVGLFVVSPGEWRAHDWAGVRVDFVLRTVRELSRTLEGLGIPLLVRSAATAGDVVATVLATAREAGCSSVECNAEYELNEARRDAALVAAVAAADLTVHVHHDQCLLAPGTVLTQSGTPFTVFTPFRRRVYQMLEEEREAGGMQGPRVPAVPRGFGRLEGVPGPEAVPEGVAGFESAVPARLWPAGEREAARRLEAFIERRVLKYKAERDRPDLDGTSVLSPYLAVGAISVRQCLRGALGVNDGKLEGGREGPACWISELVWRDFYRHIVAAFPRVCMHRAFKTPTDRIAWRRDEGELAAWKEGRTGYPIVDAAMRQLAATGWMHNRLRMISAMFLTKDLLIDWRLGERHFMRSLVDGDLASNNGGWQWSASTGTDAAPYFRVFNPASQSRKVDPEGAFIRRWVPELAGVEGDAVHEPGLLAALARARVEYPGPMVDHGRGRERALAAFKGLGAGV